MNCDSIGVANETDQPIWDPASLSVPWVITYRGMCKRRLSSVTLAIITVTVVINHQYPSGSERPSTGTIIIQISTAVYCDTLYCILYIMYCAALAQGSILYSKPLIILPPTSLLPTPLPTSSSVTPSS